MKNKPLVILIEDDPNWLPKLSKIISKFFDVEIEEYDSFLHAEKRLFESSLQFDLLVTDIYPNVESRQTTGLMFVDFVNTFKDKPIIVVTGEPEHIKKLLNEGKVIDAFDKGKFEKMEFVKAISSVIKPKVTTDQIQYKEESPKNDKGGDDNIFIG